MNRQALFCDGTGSYVIPPEPALHEEITLRFRTAKQDVDEVLLLTRDGAFPLEKTETRGEFDYYEIRQTLGEQIFTYCFQIRKGSEICYFNRCGVSDEIVEYYAFRITPGFSTPDWAKGAVMYQIFVDRFCNGNPKNNVETREYLYIGEPVEGVEDWDAPVKSRDIGRFYGGDLQGVKEKLDYLQDLGVEVVYFNPLFVSPSNHKYDTQDYDYIDPHYTVLVKDGGSTIPEGAKDNLQAEKYRLRVCDKENLEASNRFFAELVEEMHKRGIRVIMDGVFNHCGSFNKWMDRERLYESCDSYENGAFISQDSPYHSFFHFYDDRSESWPYNTKYDGWWGHDTLPKLNYEDSMELEDYIMRIGRKWVSKPFGIDGWRLDVAADLGYSNEYNHLFWKRFRREVKDANPETLILAEHYGDPAEWLRGDEWDSVMNYDAFMEPVTWFLTGMEKHSDEKRPDLLGNADYFVKTMRHYMSCMQMPSLQVAMNELSNHDHSRFLTRTNQMVGRVGNLGAEAAEKNVQKSVMRLAVVMQMTWIGAPTVYYGDEVSVCGFTDPDNRRTYPWGREDQEMLAFHREMIRLHKRNVLRVGSIKMLTVKENVLAYARFNETDQVVVILNNAKTIQEVTVPVWLCGLPMKGKMKRLICTYEESYTMTEDEYLIDQGEVVLNLGPHSAVILEPSDPAKGEKPWQL